MIRVVVNPKFESLRKAISEIPDTIVVCGEQIFQGRNRIYRATIGDIDLTVKDFRVPSVVNRWAYAHLRHGKARRSYDNAMQLAALHIETPEPIAYIEERNGGLLRRSYYICRYWDGKTVRNWETAIADSGAMLDSLALFTLDLHRKGVMHRDFSPGNIIYRIEDGKYRFALVDINRMTFGVHDKHRLYRNFRSINIESEAETLRFAEAYARAAGLDIEEMRAIARRMFLNYHREKAIHRHLKSLLGKK